MERSFRLAALGDLHCREDQHGRFRELVLAVNGEAEGLVLCGDLTDRGLVEEAKTLAEALSELRVPCAAVLGNHDYEAGQQREICRIMREAKVHLLDGEYAILDRRLGVAGVKGFGCGFDRATLQAFGEPAVKAFVQEAVNEALKLEAALGQIDTPHRIVIMHYAPIAATTLGEGAEIKAFLGTSRLAAPVDAFGAQAVFHGHAHHGTLEGRTPKGVPVYNVAMPLLKKAFDRRFRIIDVEPPEEQPLAAADGQPAGLH
ncbi:metallophosphoesterase family protein [Anaeromyxobacter diazotrophicus]|uniref:Metallophosphoesterase n=1 Tax=Anaeromyxobacter diazotrophicus TaxID=2590199 RepID=A0A7I9VR95_9BACT|nr:metallophosphoesterase [Anaeromyxobacter diazotrophicus]GEJ58630.1 metallophosphoesterase [Anaeromyxobacter diazotrophicus]